MRKLAIIIFTLLFLGCSTEPGIKIINLKTNEGLFFSANTGYFEELVSVPIESKFVFSIAREANHIKFTKRDLTGALIKENQIPLFSQFYGAIPYALSPNEAKLAYINDNTRNIYVYDLLAKTEHLLLENLVSNVFTIKGIFWSNDDTLIILLEEDADIDRKIGEIVRVDVSTKKIEEKLKFEEPMEYSFSLSKMLLAVTPMVRGQGIKIIDLKRMMFVAEIPNSNKRSWMTLSAWNRDGSKLAYIDANNTLSIYDINNKTSIAVRELPRDNVPYLIAYPTETTCVVKYGKEGKAAIYFIDLNTKSETKKITDAWGHALFLDNGNVIAYVKH